MKTSDLDINVTMNNCETEAQKPTSNLWHEKIMRIAGLAYIEAKSLIDKGQQSSDSYINAAKVVRVAIEAIKQQIVKAESVYQARRAGHDSTKDVRLVLVTAEQAKGLLESYLGQLHALAEMKGVNVVASAVNEWINKVNMAVDEKYIAESDKDWNAIYEGSSAALQFVSLDGYVYRYIKAVNALKKMLSVAKTDDKVTELAGDLNRLMERCQIAFADMMSARKVLVQKANEDKE